MSKEKNGDRSVKTIDDVNGLVALVEEFKQLLNTEITVMEARSSNALPQIIKDKEAVVSKLQEQEPKIIQLLTDKSETPAIKKLKDSLEHCQRMNRQNQTVAMIELKQARNSLELLRTLLNMDDLPLYGAGGQLDVKREKRNLGSA